MSFMEVLLMTLVNAAVCISLPKVLMMLQSKNTQKSEALAPEFSSPEATAELTSVSN
jgi:hypothetical protein